MPLFPPSAPVIPQCLGSHARGWRRFAQYLLDPSTPLQLAAQVLFFCIITGLLLGVIAIHVRLYVVLFIVLIVGGISLPIVHYFVLGIDRSYVIGLIITLATNIAATAIGMLFARLVFGDDYGGANWYGAYSATFLVTMIYIGFGLERRRSTKAKLLANENRMLLLQSQINPHFLSNTLANVSALIESDPPAAQNLLRELVSFMSDLVHYSRHESITVADALDSLETHLHIHSIRIGDRLSWSVDVPDDMHWQPLPPLIILPLIENAVTHGINAVAGNGWIKFTVRADRKTGRWWFAVENSGMRDAAKKTRGHGIAIENIRDRLRMRYGSAAEVELFWKDDQTHCARVTLPLVNNPREAGAIAVRIRPHSCAKPT